MKTVELCLTMRVRVTAKDKASYQSAKEHVLHVAHNWQAGMHEKNLFWSTSVSDPSLEKVDDVYPAE